MTIIFDVHTKQCKIHYKILPCVVGCCPLAIMPSHNCIIFGILIILLLWYLSYDNSTKKLKMCGIKLAKFLKEKQLNLQLHLLPKYQFTLCLNIHWFAFGQHINYNKSLQVTVSMVRVHAPTIPNVSLNSAYCTGP